MSLRRYEPSGRGGPFGFTAVLGTAAAGGVITGVVEGLLDPWFSLFLIFPLLIGLAAGGAAAWMIGSRQLRAPLLAMLLAAVGGAAGYVAVHTVDYLRFRSHVAELVRHDQPAASDDAVAAAMDEFLVEQTGASGFRGYLDLAAREGVRVKHTGSSDEGFAFTGTAAWIVWLCEMLLAAGTAGWIAYGRARAPFCETCEVWYGPERPFASGGAGDKPAQRRFVAALDTGDLDAAAGVLAAPGAPLAKTNATFALTTTTCPRCMVDAHCALKRVTSRRNKSQVSILETWLMARDEVTRFGEALARARPSKPG
jgi:hypothetical protein